MWMLDNRTPYAADRTWVRDKHGAHHWAVIVKATLDIGKDGLLMLADEQKPPLAAAEYSGEPGKSSLKYEADLGPMRPSTDVTLRASAHAPDGKPASSVPVSLRVADHRKVLVIYGDRIYERGLLGATMSDPTPFIVKPILYESAFGGFDTTDPDPSKHAWDNRNPVGLGFAVKKARLVGQPAHTIEYPSGEPNKLGPAGFGPIASHWSPRLERAGTYGKTWEQTKRPLLPDDYDDRFSLCSPPDQAPAGYLNGGELVELVHLTPEGVLRFSLPKIYLAYTTWIGKRREEHRGRMVSVVIEPDEKRLMVAWQTTLPVGARDVDYVDKTLIREKQYLT